MVIEDAPLRRDPAGNADCQSALDRLSGLSKG
jgi:hypothetical protein